MTLLWRALAWLAFASSVVLIVRFVALVNEQTEQGNIADEV